MGSLDGKRVIITGAAGGIGAAAVEAFVKEGARVACTFNSAQPALPDGVVASAKCDITSKVSVKTVQRGVSDSRPVDPIPYVRIGNYVVPVTMELFSSLADRDCGLRAASLTPAVFALFDTTRSIVTGEISRDPRMLEEEVLIEIGGSRQSFHLEDGETSVVARGETHAG